MELPKQPKELTDSYKNTIEKYGEDACRIASGFMDKANAPAVSPINLVMEKFDVDFCSATDMIMAGADLKMQDMRPDLEKTIENYNANIHKLPSCPDKECDGKLHVTVAIDDYFSGMYHCDGCSKMFRKKEKKKIDS